MTDLKFEQLDHSLLHPLCEIEFVDYACNNIIVDLQSVKLDLGIDIFTVVSRISLSVRAGYICHCLHVVNTS